MFERFWFKHYFKGNILH